MAEKKIKSNKMKREEKKNKILLAPKPEVRQSVPVKIIKKVRNPIQLINDIFDEKDLTHYEYKYRNIAELMKHSSCNLKFLKELLLKLVYFNIDFTPSVNYYGEPHLHSSTRAIVNLSLYTDQIVRPLEDWKPKSYNLAKQIASLSRHLYAKYYVPSFLDASWYRNDGAGFQKWFIHIGQGNNIRTVLNLPISLTKKEAHYFLQSPNDFTPLQAIRYGQILNLGGKEPLVRQILRTRIVEDFNHDEFWMSVFRWLLKHPMLDTNQYAPIIDYIFNQKYVPGIIDENGCMVAPQPNLSMKDRDPEALIRQVELWHKQLGNARTSQNLAWGACGIKEYFTQSKDKTIYTIKEILTQKDLITEGKTMHHCAGSYARSCYNGSISIWKFEEMNTLGIEKRLTIEVRNSDKTIMQARGKYNSKPTNSDLFYLRNWASIARLSMSRWLS